MKMPLKASLSLILLVVIVGAMGSITYHEDRQSSSGQDLKGLIPWRSDMDSARREAVAANKPLFVEFVASWCPYCHDMAHQCWTRSDIATAMQAYVPVLADMDANRELAMQYNVEAIPAIFIVDPKSGAITREVRERVLSPDEMLAWLK
jgi:thiol:disulfide interchange protein